MNEFIRIFLQNAFMVSYLLVVILSIVRYPKYFDTPLKFLPVVFSYTLLTEVLGGVIRENENWSFFSNELFNIYNLVIYNIYYIIFFLYFYYIYWSYLRSRLFRLLVAYGASLFLVVSVINPFFQHFLYESQTFAYLTGTLVLLLAIVLYSVEQFKNDLAIPSRYNLIFWLSIGLVVFFACYLPIEIYRYWNFKFGGREPIYVRSIVHGLILLMNLIFCVGFIKMNSKPLSVKE
jgi:hypothetical protein